MFTAVVRTCPIDRRSNIQAQVSHGHALAAVINISPATQEASWGIVDELGKVSKKYHSASTKFALHLM